MKPMNDHAQAPAQFPMARRDYKDTLFRLLFQDRDRLLSLYNAVKGTSYASSEELTVVTLENAVYMNMKNDVAFLVDFQLNLYEHQSTWNPNMPLRNLFYAAKEYQTLTRDQSLYAPQLVKILKIAPGKNKELMDTCQTLKEYMLFVERVRLHAKTMAVQAAVHRAVTECIREGILKEFLECKILFFRLIYTGHSLIRAKRNFLDSLIFIKRNVASFKKNLCRFFCTT